MKKLVLITVLSIPVLLFVFAGCESQNKRKAAEELMAKEEKNKDFIKAYNEDIWNNHNMSAFEKYYAADFIDHTATGDMNLEQVKGICQAYFTACPDLNITIDLIVAEGDKVTKVWTSSGTHNGEFMGIPATGKQITIKGIEVFRIADGKIVEVWASMDNLGMLQQLGAIPPMGGE
jgi:steroid delta-isomerase-like uncharacterized protein